MNLNDFFFSIFKVPSAPQLNVTDVTDLEYSFEWILPEYIPGKILNYEIEFMWDALYPIPDKCNSLKNNLTIIDGSMVNYTHQKGSPFSHYEARIRAKTRAGYGSYSESVFFTSEAGGEKQIFPDKKKKKYLQILFVNNFFYLLFSNFEIDRQFN